MKIYIWEGRGISSAYHDDGTLVVLAESPAQARKLAIDSAKGPEDFEVNDRWRDGNGYGSEKCLAAIKRAPDRVIDLDAARVVVFNGGGYD